MVKRQEKSVLKNLIVKNTLFLLFYSTLIKIYFTPDFIEPFKTSAKTDVFKNLLYKVFV